MIDFGKEIVPVVGMPKVKAVSREKIRAEFYNGYTAENPGSKRRAFNRMMADAAVKSLIASKEIAGEDWIWFMRDEQDVGQAGRSAGQGQET